MLVLLYIRQCSRGLDIVSINWPLEVVALIEM